MVMGNPKLINPSDNQPRVPLLYGGQPGASVPYGGQPKALLPYGGQPGAPLPYGGQPGAPLPYRGQPGGAKLYTENDEDPENSDFRLSNVTIRSNFIRKVYMIVCIQLIATACITVPFIFLDGLKDFVWEHPYILPILSVLSICILCLLSCGPEWLRRETPFNLMLLALFTILEGLALGCFIAFVPALTIIVFAFGITVLTVLVVTIISCSINLDITGMGGVCMLLFIVLFISGIVILIVELVSPTTNESPNPLILGFTTFIAFALVGLLALHTQIVMGGKRYSLGPEEYILAAVLLYADIMGIIWTFLLILWCCEC